MKNIKKILKKIRLRLNKIGSKKRSTKLLIKNPTIISNNCYAGIVYEYLGIKFSSPTIGLYFFASEYLKFISNLKHYVQQELIFIPAKESKYYKELLKKKHENSIIGKLDDIEIVFLHYKSEEEAKNKWNRRCKRINWDCIMYKFCDQNLCTEQHIKEFEELPLEHKICFTSKNYPQYSSTIWIKKDKNCAEVRRDYYIGHKYFDIISFLNHVISKQNSKIKVLQCGMTYDMGGIENFLKNYYENIDKNCVTFDFINIYDKNLCYQKELEKMDSKIYRVSSYYSHPIKYMKDVSAIIKNYNYQIVHCNMNSAVMFFPLLVAKINKVKVIIAHAHNASSDKGILKLFIHNITKHILPMLANEYFACSKKAGGWFYNSKIMNSKQYHFIPNAIYTEKFIYTEEVRNKMRKQLNIKKDTIVIGHVGRFVKQKNHKFLLNLFYQYHQKHQNSILILVGEGPLLLTIKQQIKDLNLENSVMLLGKRTDMECLYQCFDLFIMPSIYEGLPLVGIEAQASGLPCIFSDEITNEVKINDNVFFISLKDTYKKWIDVIDNIQLSNNKVQLNDNVKNSIFDIKTASKMLTEIYCKGIGKHDRNR